MLAVNGKNSNALPKDGKNAKMLPVSFEQNR